MADPEFDDASWETVQVPGHWRSTPAFAGSDGPVIYRRRFQAAAPDPGVRTFLVLDGLFYQGDVWLDGDYLGDTEGYFFPHQFEVTEAVGRADEHLLAVEVTCARPSDLRAKRSLTGVFQHWDCIDPDWNPGGIWAGVRLERTGAVRINGLRVLCVEASAERAVLELEATLDSRDPLGVSMRTAVVPSADAGGPPAAEHHQDRALSEGLNVVRWRVVVERPELWWPRALGPQPLYDVTVKVDTDAPSGPRASDRRVVTTGLRHVRLRNFIASVNGERLFLKGANYGPTRRALAEASPDDVRGDVERAATAGLDLLRVHAHIGRPELYEAADRLGILIWQDLPLQWGYGNVRRQAVQQARRATELLGHHPSIAVWCGHNEPVAVAMEPGQSTSLGTVARVVAGQALPTWNKTGLDRSIRRALERSDRSRDVIAHSGVVPHPAWGTDSHLYFGWYHGNERDFPRALSRLPVLARFVSEFGAQSVPDSAGFMDPGRWPDLDWDHLQAHHALQHEIFAARVRPGDFASFEEWRQATQEYQAMVLRHHIETLRRLKYRPTGGFCFFLFADAQPAVSWAVLDHERVPKLAFQAVTDACAPVIVTADRPAASYRPGDRLRLDVHVVSDLRIPLRDCRVDATLRWPGGRRTWRFAGTVGADSCSRVGRLDFPVPDGCPAGALDVELQLHWPGGSRANRYKSEVTDGRDGE